MCASHIRLPDGRLVTAATDREVLLDALADVLCGRQAMPLSQIKTLACWVFRSGRNVSGRGSSAQSRGSIAERLAASAAESAAGKGCAGDGCRA